MAVRPHKTVNILVPSVWCLLFLLVAMPRPGRCETIVGGEISGYTTWDAAGSPYHATSSVTVNEGVTLTIEPGVRVEFDAGLHLMVKGVLDAQGTETDGIVFTSSSATPSSGDWDCIYLDDTTGSGASLEYCEIGYSNRGFYVDYRSPTISHCYFHDNATGCHAYGTAYPQILNCSIENNDTGILAESRSYYGVIYIARPTVNGCNFENNSVANLKLYCSNAYHTYNHIIINAQGNWWGTDNIDAIEASIVDYEDDYHLPGVNWSSFLDGPDGDPVSTAPGGETYLIAGTLGNTVLNGDYLVLGRYLVPSGQTLDVDPATTVYFESGAFMLVIDNGALTATGDPSNPILFTSSEETPAMGDWNGIQGLEGSDIQLSHCTVEYSNNGVYTSYEAQVIQNCDIRHNITGIYIYGRYTTQILNCSISDNQTGIYLKSQPQYGHIASATINGCDFNGNSVYNLHIDSTDPRDWSTTVLDARNTWWGTSDTAAIRESIYDYEDNNHLAAVNWSGFLDGPVGNPILTASGGETYLIAGTMENTVLDGTYLVLSRHLVRSGHTLGINPGTTVFFETGAYLDVADGATFSAVGSQSDSIEFTSFADSPAPADWTGLRFFENSAANLSYCNISYANNGVYISYASPEIANCDFHHNIKGGYVYGTATPLISECSFENNDEGLFVQTRELYSALYIANPTVNNCRFDNNATSHLHIDCTNQYSSWNTTMIDARNNWWGSTDTDQIMAAIIDYEDNSLQALIDWTGFLDAAAGNPVLTAPGGETYLIAGTTENTALSGVYLVPASYHAMPGHELTFDPGTTIKFDPDASLRVRNGATLTATGTSDSRIYLLSSQAEPALADWTGLLFDSGSSGSLEHVVSTHAAYGIYINSASPSVADSLFEYDTYGVYATHGGTATLDGCVIRDNNTGIFANQKNASGRPIPTVNNCSLYDNTTYNYQLHTDSDAWEGTILDAENNWWGVQNPAEIADTIWDYDDDTNLGSVDFDPWKFHIVDEDGPSMSNIRYNGASIQSGDTATAPASFELEASDSVSGVNRVSFYVDGVLKHTDSKYTGTYSFFWNIVDVDDGAHEVIITSFDNLGNETSETLSLAVALGLPDVPAIAFPANGLVTGRSTLTVTGTAPVYTTVSLYNNDTLASGNVPVDADGNFSASVVLNEGDNAIQAESVHRAGQSPKCDPVTVTMDPDALSSPTDFQLTAKPGGVIRLSWKPPLNNVFTGYNIYRSENEFTENGQAAKITADPVEGIIYDDTPGQEIVWYYAMTTVDSLSDESDPTDVLSVAADATPPAATEIVYTPHGAFDPASGRMGPGDVDVRVTVSEPLMSAPFFSVRPPASGLATVVLSEASETEYTGSFEITDSMGSGTAQATFSARDKAGNQGTAVESGDTCEIDAEGPSVIRLDIEPVSPVNNDTPQTIALTAGLDEEIPDGQSPDFFCQLSGAGRDPIDISLSKIAPAGEDVQTWQGAFDLPADAGSPDAESFYFIYQGSDDLGNVGDDIDVANLFQAYQGDLPPLEPPVGLEGTALPAGQVELAWQEVQGASGYQVYRKAPGETEWQEHRRLGAETGFIDDTAVDGPHEYAMASVRSANSQEGVSVKSASVTVESDSEAPSPALQNLALALLGAGIQANWNDPGYPETVTYNLYRSGDTQITDVSGLTPVMTGIADTTAVDATPSITDHCYAVTAVDVAGNESLPSESAYLNFELLPVNTLQIVRTDSEFPVVSWTHTGSNIAGYNVYLDLDGEWVLMNDTLIASSQFVDTGYSGPSRLYSVTAVDDNDFESVGRSLLLPEIVFSLTEGEPVHRGVMNILKYQVENRAGQDLDDLAFHAGIETHDQRSETFSLSDAQADTIEVIVPGHADLPDSSLLETKLEMTPNPGETVQIVRNGAISVAGGMPVTRIFYETLVRGANSAVYFSMENTGDAPMDLVAARGFGQSASDEIAFNLLDEDGNVLSSAPFRQAVGEMVSTLPNGDVVARIPAGEIFTSEPVGLLIQEASTDDVTIELVVEKIHYQYQTPQSLSMAGLVASKEGTIIDTTYYGQILSVDPENSRGESGIAIAGEAIFRATGDPLASTPLHLAIENNGFERIFNVFTDDGGMFEYTFTPGSDESGVFLVDAVHPDLDERSFDSQFVIERVAAIPSAMEIDLPRNYPQTLSFAIACGSGTEVHNLRLAFDAEDQPGGVFPDGVQVAPDAGVAYIRTGETRTLSMTLAADNSSAADVDLVLAVESDETGTDAWTTIFITAHFSQGAPSLSFTPDGIETGLDHNEIVDALITLQNTGSAPLSNIVLNLAGQDLSPAPEWAHMNTVANTDILAAGESLPVNLQFSPGGAVSYSQYDLILRVASAQLPMTDIPITVAVTDSDTGNALFKVEDIYTGTDDGEGGIVQGVEGAEIHLENVVVPSIEADGATGESGEALFTDLSAGNYSYRIAAPKHTTKIGRIAIHPETTASEQVFLESELIDISWDVIPVTLEDRYEIILNATYETDVPAAVVVSEPASIHLPDMAAGDVFQGEFDMVNYGLITAEQIDFQLPPDTDYYNFELMGSLPDTLAAQQRITIAYRVTCIKTPGETEPENKVRSISGNEAVGVRGDEPASLGCGLDLDCVAYTYLFKCENMTEYWATNFFCFGSAWGECWTPDLEDGKAVPIKLGIPASVEGNGTPFSPEPQEVDGTECWPILCQKEDLCNWLNGKLHAAGCWADAFRNSYFDEVLDLSVIVPGGNVDIRRRYYMTDLSHNRIEIEKDIVPWDWELRGFYQYGWYLDHFNRDSFTGDVATAKKGYTARKGDVRYYFDNDKKIYYSDTYRIMKNDDGHLWMDKYGNWKQFNDRGQLSSYGTPNGTTAKVVYNATHRPYGIMDRNNRMVVRFDYEELEDLFPSIITDYTGRTVEYSCRMSQAFPMNKLLIETVTDPLEKTSGYNYGEFKVEYPNMETHIKETVDANGRSTYSHIYEDSGFLVGISDSAGVGHYSGIKFLAETDEWYNAISGPGGRLEETWYDSDGRVTRKTVNRRPALSVTRSGRTTTLKDGNGRIWKQKRDERANLTYQKYPDGAVAKFEYEPKYNRMTKYTTPNGFVHQFGYDDRGNMTQMTMGAGTSEQRTLSFTYDDAGQVLTSTVHGQTPDDDSITQFVYDTDGSLISITDAMDGVMTFSEHDAMGNPSRAIDRNDRTWLFDFDAKGRLLSITNPLGKAASMEWDNVNLLKATVNTLGKRFEYEHDDHNRLTKSTGPGGKSAQYKYSPGGYPIEIKDEEGKTLNRSFDNEGRLLAVIDGMNNETQFTYDLSGACPVDDRPVAIDYPTYRREVSYDLRGRPLKVTDKSEDNVISEISLTYDPAGNITAVADAEGRESRYAYDALNRVVSATDPKNATILYGYDDYGNLASLTNANGHAYLFEYDKLFRLATLAHPMGQDVAYEYDPEGNKTAVLDAKGQKIAYEYDSAGRMIACRHYAVGDHTVPVGEIAMGYDDGNRLISWDDGEISAVYTYDDYNRRNGATIDYGDFSLGYAYTFYDNGQKKTYIDPDGVTHRYSYDNAGRLISIDIDGTGEIAYSDFYWNRPEKTTLPGGHQVQNTYDPFMRIETTRMLNAGDQEVFKQRYRYSPVGNLVERQTLHGTYTYQYDDVKNLTGAVNPQEDDEAYTYDPHGNRLTSAATTGNWTYDDNDRLTGNSEASFAYDDNGNMTRKNEGGNITHYFYDVEDRLTRVEDDLGTVLAFYGYDPLGRRVYKEVSGVRTYFFYSHEGLAAECDAEGNLIRTYGWEPDCLWSTRPIYQQAGGNIYWYADDHLGTPQKMIDANGSIVWSGHYDSFGKCRIDIETAVNNLRYPGQYFDEETGFHNNYMRHYDPQIGRYIRQDPMLFFGGLNLYAYGLNSPTMIIDPMGLCILYDIGRGTLIDMIAGGISGGVAGAFAGTAAGGVGALPGAAAGALFGIYEGFQSGLVSGAASAVLSTGANASRNALGKMGSAADWSDHGHVKIMEVTKTFANTYVGNQYPGQGYDVYIDQSFEGVKTLYLANRELGPYSGVATAMFKYSLKDAKNYKDFLKNSPDAIKKALSTIPPHKWDKVADLGKEGLVGLNDFMLKSILDAELPKRKPTDDFRPLHCEKKVGMDPLGMIFADPLKPCCE